MGALAAHWQRWRRNWPKNPTGWVLRRASTSRPSSSHVCVRALMFVWSPLASADSLSTTGCSDPSDVDGAYRVAREARMDALGSGFYACFGCSFS